MTDTKGEATTRVAAIQGSTTMYVEKFYYDELAIAINQLRAKHERVLQMLEIAESALIETKVYLGVIGGMTTDEVVTGFINKDGGPIDVIDKAIAQIEELKK